MEPKAKPKLSNKYFKRWCLQKTDALRTHAQAWAELWECSQGGAVHGGVGGWARWLKVNLIQSGCLTARWYRVGIKVCTFPPCSGGFHPTITIMIVTLAQSGLLHFGSQQLAMSLNVPMQNNRYVTLSFANIKVRAGSATNSDCGVHPDFFASQLEHQQLRRDALHTPELSDFRDKWNTAWTGHSSKVVAVWCRGPFTWNITEDVMFDGALDPLLSKYFGRKLSLWRSRVPLETSEDTRAANTEHKCSEMV